MIDFNINVKRLFTKDVLSKISKVQMPLRSFDIEDLPSREHVLTNALYLYNLASCEVLRGVSLVALEVNKDSKPMQDQLFPTLFEICKEDLKSGGERIELDKVIKGLKVNKDDLIYNIKFVLDDVNELQARTSAHFFVKEALDLYLKVEESILEGKVLFFLRSSNDGVVKSSVSRLENDNVLSIIGDGISDYIDESREKLSKIFLEASSMEVLKAIKALYNVRSMIESNIRDAGVIAGVLEEYDGDDMMDDDLDDNFPVSRSGVLKEAVMYSVSKNGKVVSGVFGLPGDKIENDPSTVKIDEKKVRRLPIFSK